MANSEKSEKKIISKDEIKEIMKNIEANIVGCFWHNPNLFFDYNDLNMDNFKSDIWKFFFTIGKKMAIKNIKKLDEVAVELFLQTNEKLNQVYENYGGYEIIKNLELFSTIENIEAYINELKKWNTVYNMIDTLTFDEEYLKKIKDMNTDEIYRFYNAQMNNVFINVNDDVKTSKLEEGLEQIIENSDKGLERGMTINSPMLDNEIGGFMNGQILLVAGLSGTGKTSWTQEVLLSKIWELEEPIVIILNEQDDIKWKKQMLTWIINNKLKPKNKDEQLFNSKRWRDGHFTIKEKEYLIQATKLLREKIKDNKIILAEFKTYSQKRAERFIRKYASLGITKFVLDTFKLSSDRSENDAFWLSMQEDMRKFDDLVKPANLNVSLWCTLQLQKGSRLLRYLTGDNIGMAKNVVDVASVALLMRKLWNDEYKGGTHEIEVKLPIVGTDSYKIVELDSKKKYVIIFIEKNRNGDAQSYQIVAEQDLGNLIYKEVGICDVPFSS